MMPGWPRRAVQTGAIVFAVAVPALNYGGVLYQQYGKNAYHTVALMGTWFERVLYLIFSAGANYLPDPVENSAAITGGFGSFSIFGATFFDPVVALETLLRAPGAWAGLLAGVALTLLIAALLGRVFCGWLCPVNTVLEGIDLLRTRLLPRLGFRPGDLPAPRWVKWVLLLAGLAAALLADFALWANLLPHVQIGRDVFSLIFFGTVAAGAPLLAVIILAELLISRRIWCRSLCPTGAVLGLFGAFSPLRVRRAERTCRSGCAACGGVCPSGLNPAEPMAQAECMNCALCVSACPEELLSLLPKRPQRVGYGDIVPAIRRFTFFFIVGLAAALAPLPATAHHMRSQPHYGYAENYPQVPTKEIRAQMGGYEVIVVSYFFEGLRRERSDTPDDVQFYVGLMNAKTHQSYTGPLLIELRHEGRRIALFDHARPFEEAVYRVRQKVQGPGRYELRLTAGDLKGAVSVDVEGKESYWTPYLVLGGVLILTALFVLNRRRRIRFRGQGGSHVASGT